MLLLPSGDIDQIVSFLFCEINKDKEEFEEIIKIFSNTDIKELNIVLFK